MRGVHFWTVVPKGADVHRDLTTKETIMSEEQAGSRDLGFEAHLREQAEQIFSDYNRHITREKLGREPTDSELAWNFIRGGGAEALAIKNNRNVAGANL